MAQNANSKQNMLVVAANNDDNDDRAYIMQNETQRLIN
jgi:hypothetical protein